MREIKFRAYGKGGYFHCLQSIHFDKEIGISVLSTLDSMTLWGDDFILEQFTGLHDKNGKEIYEGDIVKAETNKNGVCRVSGTIIYKEAEYCIDQDDDYFPICSLSVVDLTSIEVIGNIHKATK